MIIQEERKLLLLNGESVTINPAPYANGGSFLAKGGEANVYRNGNKVFKLYYEPGQETKPKYIPDDKLDKLKLLSFFNSPYIVSPKGFVFNKSGDKKPIGFWMHFAEGEPLARLFTTSGRNRLKLTDRDTCVLVERMRETVELAHGYRCIIVDHNDLNWVVNTTGKYGPEPRIMDVDSWMTRQWGPKAVSPLYEDYSANRHFDQGSDWFTWGVATFQLFTGIHPYKGDLPGYKLNDTISRMKDNKSVFSKKVVLSQAVRSFKSIPPELLKWYKEVFQEGRRDAPPMLQLSTKRITALPIAYREASIQVPSPGSVSVIVVPAVTERPKRSFTKWFRRLFIIDIPEEPEVPKGIVEEEVEEPTVETPPPTVQEVVTEETTTTSIEDVLEAVLQEPVVETTPPPPTPTLEDDLLEITNEVALESDRLVYGCIYHHKYEQATKVFPSGVVLTTNGKLFDIASKKFFQGEYTSKCIVVGLNSKTSPSLTKLKVPGESRKNESVSAEGDTGWLVVDETASGWQYFYITRNTFEQKVVTGSGEFESINACYDQSLVAQLGRDIYMLELDAQALTINFSKTYSFAKKAKMEWVRGVGIERFNESTLLVYKNHESYKSIEVKELEKVSVIDAYCGENYIALSIIDKSNRMMKYEYTVLPKSYALWKEMGNINLAYLPKGNIVSVQNNGILESYVIQSGAVQLIPDKHVSYNVPLYSSGNNVCCVYEGRVYTISVKKA